MSDIEKEHDDVDSQHTFPIVQDSLVGTSEKSIDPQLATATDVSNGDQKATPQNDDDWEYVTGFKLIIVLVTVTLAAFLLLLDTSIIVTAIPSITTDFHSLNDVGWYGSAYLLTSSALQPTSGKLYQQLSSKWTFISFLGVFELGSLLCGVATSSKMLIVGRAVAGLGGSGLVNGALTILSACVPLHKRAAYLGIMMSCCQLGVLLGPLIGGALTQYTTWRWCFYINLPAGAVVASMLCFIHIPDRTDKTTKRTFIGVLKSLDLIGLALFAPTIIMFLLPLQWGGTNYAWGSATIIGLFCGAAGNAALFFAWQHKMGEAAMIPISMLRNRIVACAAMTQFFFMGTMLITSYYLPIYFQAVKGVTPTLSGVYMLPGIVSQIVMATVSGVLVSKLGYYLPWALASNALNSIGAGLISLFTPTSGTGTWIGYQILGGAGRGCGMQMPMVAVSAALKPQQAPIGMALLVFNQNLGGSVWLAVANAIFANSLSKALLTNAPNVSAELVQQAGATGFRHIVPLDAIAGVIESYNTSVSHVFYIAASLGVAGFVVSSGLGWVSVKKPKTVAPEA